MISVLSHSLVILCRQLRTKFYLYSTFCMPRTGTPLVTYPDSIYVRTVRIVVTVVCETREMHLRRFLTSMVLRPCEFNRQSSEALEGIFCVARQKGWPKVSNKYHYQYGTPRQAQNLTAKYVHT